jgi:hypothetical protein
MPALIDRYYQVSDQSRELFHLLECLGYVAAAYGDAFALPLFHRCIKIIYGNLQESVAAVNNEGLDFLIINLDLLSAIDPAKSDGLVVSAEPRFFNLLYYCMTDPNNEVRQ